MVTALDIRNEALKYNHPATEAGAKVSLDISRENKADLLKLLEKSQFYNGNEQVVLEHEFPRENSYAAIAKCVDEIKKDFAKKIVKKADNEGNTIESDIKKNFDSLGEILSIDDLTRESEGKEKVVLSEKWDVYGNYKPSVRSSGMFERAINVFKTDMATVNSYFAETIASIIPALKDKIVEGQKISRAFRKLFVHYNLCDKDFDKKFAIYSDLVSEKNPVHKVVISTNFLDFMRMSFGNSWSSCHTIDNDNRRKIKLTRSDTSSYGGMSANGTLSYALDTTSFIMYVVSSKVNSEHPEDANKIYRCMFHWNDGVLIQGRVYPQCFDGTTDLSKIMRLIMQEFLAKALDIEYINNSSGCDTWKKLGDTRGKNGAYRDFEGNPINWISRGTHYRDYDSFSGPNMSILKNYEKTGEGFVIGHKTHCLYCGKDYENGDYSSYRLSHTTCGL